MKQEYGDSSSYKNSAHATWQFVHDIKIGDVVFVKKGNNGILGKGIVESDYEYDADRADEYSSRRRHTRSDRDWSSDVCSSDLSEKLTGPIRVIGQLIIRHHRKH